MILRYEGPNQNQIPIKGPVSGKTYRTKVRSDGSFLFNVHPDDAQALMQRTRKGQPLFTEYVQPQKVTKPEPVKTTAPQLPPVESVMDDIWADVPIELVESVKEKAPLTFDTVADFQAWISGEGKPDEDTLAEMLVAEQTGKNRSTITKELKRLLNG